MLLFFFAGLVYVFFSLLLRLGSCLILRCDDCMSVGVVSFVRLEGFVFGLIFCNDL
jgi:hypothetical protein